MRIALIGPVRPYRGGVSQFTTSLAEELRRADEVLVLSWRQQYPGWLYPGGAQHDGEVRGAGTPTTRFLLDYRNPASVAVGVRLLRRWRADAVVLTWTTTFTAPYYLLLLGLLRAVGVRIPVVAVCHNVLPHERRPFDAVLTRAVLGQVDGAIVHSDEQLAALAAVAPATPGRSLAMPRFGPPARSGAGSRDDVRRRLGLHDRVILFFGAVRPYKGLDGLIEALALVDPSLGVTLLVAGQFWEPRGPYDQLIGRLDLGHRVRIVDEYIPDAAVADYFAAADAVVLPYRDATQSAVVQLAFAHRRPVIATAVGGIPEVVEDGVTGLLVPPSDSARLAEAIERFYRQELGARLQAAISEEDDGWTSYAAGLRAVVAAARRSDGRTDSLSRS